MEVLVEVTPEVFSDKVGALGRPARQAGRLPRAHAGASRAHVRLVGPQTIQRSEGKAKRVFDRRKSVA